eukprot:c10254_g1_i2.p1 GENE.c10254_g1_i2~~c10254_g1_i2.p1  ORF type:complete len:333 (+),score=65.94 c10254_g1_i2:31-1029(+)
MEDKICRFCFSGEEPDAEDQPNRELVSPCGCRGDQKYVHVECLRKWQITIVVQQPSHPQARASANDLRHLNCGVCSQPFSIPPPTQLEILRRVFGDMDAMIESGGLLVSSRSSSRLIGALLQRVNTALYMRLNHWAWGVFLMTQVVRNDAEEDGGSVVAVNLAWPIETLPEPLAAVLEEQLGPNAVASDDPSRPQVNMSHFIGGPCTPLHPTALAIIPQSDLNSLGNSTVNLSPCWNDPEQPPHESNSGPLCAVWGEVAEVYNVAVESATRNNLQTTTIKVFWGDARWNRAQLLSETARGSWGMCGALHKDYDQMPATLWKTLMVRVQISGT